MIYTKNKNQILILLIFGLIIPLFCCLNSMGVTPIPNSTRIEGEKTPTTALSKSYTEKLNPVDDSSVDEGNPDYTNGSADYLLVSGYYDDGETIYKEDWCYFKYRINSSLGTFKSAKVEFTIPIAYESAILGLYSTTNDWDEETLTWNNKPQRGSLIQKFYVNESDSTQDKTIDISTLIEGDNEFISLILSYYDKTNTTGAGSFISSKESVLGGGILHYTYEIAVSIDLLSPTTDSVWTFGDNSIQWTASSEIDYFIVELYKGSSKIQTLSSFQNNDGIFTVRITKDDTDQFPTSDDYKVKLIDYEDSSISKTSETFSINTNIDSDKGDLIGPYDSYVEYFNAESDTKYLFTYEFSVKQTYNLAIRDQEAKVLYQEEITEKQGSFTFKPDKTETLIIIITTDNKYGYLKLNHIEASSVPSFQYPFLFLSSALMAIGIIIRMSKKNF